MHVELLPAVVQKFNAILSSHGSFVAFAVNRKHDVYTRDRAMDACRNSFVLTESFAFIDFPDFICFVCHLPFGGRVRCILVPVDVCRTVFGVQNEA